MSGYANPKKVIWLADVSCHVCGGEVNSWDKRCSRALGYQHITCEECIGKEYGVIVCKVLWVDAYIGPACHVEGNEQVNTFVCSIEVIEGHGLGSCYTFGPYDIGHTVFMTREAAEAEMEKQKGGRGGGEG